MNTIHKKRKGFTLLEILLVIAAIGILAAIVLVAINPNRQLAQARNTVRQADINTIQKALEQYLIEKGRYPNSISTTPGYICNTGVEQSGGTTTDCNGRVDLRELVPIYIAGIPKDPQATGTNTGYIVATNPDNNRVSLQASFSERGVLVINPLSIVKDGLVLHLDAGNTASYPGTGTTWNDLSGNGNNGTLLNGVGYNGINGGSLLFDGVNDYGSIPNNSQLTPPTELTVSMWAKADPSNAGWTRLFGRDPYYTSYLIFLESGGSLIRALHYPNGSEVRCNTNYSISTTQFTHIVFTFRMGDAIRSYFNSVPSTTVALPSGTFSYSSSNPFLFGHIGENQFNGNIAQVSIYNRALTPEEIQQNFNATRGRYGL